MSFNPSNEPGTCLYCGRKLKPQYHTLYDTWHEAPLRCDHQAKLDVSGFRQQCPAPFVKIEDGYAYCAEGHKSAAVHRSKRTGKELAGYGAYLDGFFCTLACGQRFGVAMARLGKRLQPPAATS